MLDFILNNDILYIVFYIAMSTLGFYLYLYIIGYARGVKTPTQYKEKILDAHSELNEFGNGCDDVYIVNRYTKNTSILLLVISLLLFIQGSSISSKSINSFAFLILCSSIISLMGYLLSNEQIKYNDVTDKKRLIIEFGISTILILVGLINFFACIDSVYKMLKPQLTIMSVITSIAACAAIYLISSVVGKAGKETNARILVNLDESLKMYAIGCILIIPVYFINIFDGAAGTLFSVLAMAKIMKIWLKAAQLIQTEYK